jgi:hypothetical protein
LLPCSQVRQAAFDRRWWEAEGSPQKTSPLCCRDRWCYRNLEVGTGMILPALRAGHSHGDCWNVTLPRWIGSWVAERRLGWMGWRAGKLHAEQGTK